MGLDMYLTRKKFIWSKDRKNITISGLDISDPEEIKEISFEAGYWRKANAIHKWFVDNIQDGEDDCKEYYVSIEDMKRLLDTVNKVLKASKLVKARIQVGTQWTKEKGEEPIMEDGYMIENPEVAMELLPTESGFFFGSTDYNNYYIDDLKETKKILDKALKNTEDDYYYSSSW